MTFADLRLGDHFIWPLDLQGGTPENVNVNIKIAWAEDGGGFAVDMATRKDCVYQKASRTGVHKQWIPGDAQVIKLNGSM